MPYTTLTLDQLSTQLGVLLDDENSLYWPVAQKYFAIQEALYVFGSITNYWRGRGAFNLNPSQSNPYYDLSTLLPALRPRTWTLDQITKDIQFMCLEAANGISGAGMSGQISIESILQSIQRARNQFIIDAKFPLSVTPVDTPPSADGSLPFPDTTVYVHRAAWQDGFSGTWTNLWREDEWSIDHADPTWTITPGVPKQYSESDLAPLQLQLSPAPLNPGLLELLTVDSLLVDLTDPDATFNIPNEWMYAVKYAALQDIFSSESQNKDALRAQYAEMRYQQAVDFARSARSIVRLLRDGVPLQIDALASIDSGNFAWRNQSGPPAVAGVLYDIAAISPGSPNQAYGMTADVVQSAPIPTVGTDYIPLGSEDIPHIIDYATHMLTFKCGGQEFTDSFKQYDSFLEAAARRGGINKAKIRYLTPLFAQPQKEMAERPDMMEVSTK